MANTKDQLMLNEELLGSHFAEAYRALRANIGFSSIDQPVKTVLVTSASPREGKTTTVINLGIIMAQAGAQVLIVDADFRRPSLHKIMGSTLAHKSLWSDSDFTPPGLSNLIIGNKVFAEVVLPTQFAQLSLLPAGVMPPYPGELLGSERMRSVVKDLAERTDTVPIE